MSTHHYHDNLRDKNNVCANVFVKKNASDNITYHLCNFATDYPTPNYKNRRKSDSIRKSKQTYRESTRKSKGNRQKTVD